MTTPSETNVVYFTGADSTSVFSYTYQIFDDDDLRVVVKKTSSGLETPLVKTTDYTVSGVGDGNGGSVTLVDADQLWLTGANLATGYTMSIRRSPQVIQETDIRNEGQGYKSVLENQFDKGIHIAQDQQNQLDRSLKIPETENPASYTLTIPAAALRASMALGFDSSGNLTAASAFTPGTTASAFVQTLLDDTTAALFLDTLLAGLTAETAPAAGDSIILYDASAAAIRRMTAANFLALQTETLSTVAAKTSAYPIVAADNRKTFTNEGAASSVAITLPTAAAGYEFTFIVQDADGIVVTANTGDTIQIGGVVGAAAGTATSTNIGSTLRLTSINATEWVAVAHEGTWLVA